MAVDGAQFAVLVGPIVPDGDALVVQGLDVGVAGEEPQKFVDDGFQVQLLGRQQRKAGAQVEPHLIAEDALGAGAGAVALEHAFGPDVTEQVEVLLHERSVTRPRNRGIADFTPLGRRRKGRVKIPVDRGDGSSVNLLIFHLEKNGGTTIIGYGPEETEARRMGCIEQGRHQILS